jgi:HK97 family phage portal protein
MKFTERVAKAYKSFFSPTLSNSVSGQVIRNSGRGNGFNPQQQVRGITYKAIDKIGASLSDYTPIITRPDGEPYAAHPFYTVFNTPNPIQRTSSDFIHLYGMLTEIYGETFWYLVRGESTKKVKEIYLLNPAQVELKIHGGELIGYILHKNDGTQVAFELDEIYHDKKPNPFNEWRGMSVLERASQYVDIELTTTSFTLNYMRNNASPSGIVSLPDMDKETFKQFAQQWREGYEGPENAGKTAFIRGANADFKAVGATLQDVDQEITRKMAKDDVLMMLEVPKPLLGGSEDNGFGRASIEALYLIFTKEKIDPAMKRLDRIYETIIGMQPRAGAVTSGAAKVTHESPIPEDKEFIHKENKDLVNIALTVNEVRARMGYEPIPDGDTIQPKNVVQPEPTKAARVTLAKKLTNTEIAKGQQEKNEAYRKRLYETNDIYATKMKTAINKFAATQEKEVLSKMGTSKKAYEEWLFNVKEESEQLTAVLTPVAIELMEAQLADAANFISGELITVTTEMRNTITAQIKEIAGVYNTDTIKALEKTIGEGVTNGESLNKLSKRVEQTYSDARGYRAERIAKTESGRASNLAAQQTYFENGYSETQWFTNPGACDFCQTMAATTKEIGKPYLGVGDVLTTDTGAQMAIDYTDISTPPLHPNCKCSIVPSGKRLQD